MKNSIKELVSELRLVPHPEGGFYRELYRDGQTMTTIYFVLERGKPSRWHRVMGSSEVWAYHAGAPVQLDLTNVRPSEGAQENIFLGVDLSAGQQPQYVVPPDVWQSARTLGAWSWVSCVVAPSFSFEKFELFESED